MVAWLLYCAASNAGQARVGRLLAGVLIILSILDVIVSLSFMFTSDTWSINPYAAIALIVFLGLYFINRRGGVTFTAVGLLVLFMILIPWVSANLQSGIGTILVFPVIMVIAVTLAGVLFSWRGVILVALGVSGEIALMMNVTSPVLIAYRQSDPQDTFSVLIIALLVVWAVGGLAAFYSHQMRQTLDRLEQQNSALAAQSTRERALIAQMQITAASVSNSAAEITAGAAQQTQGAEEQAAAITAVTSTVTELSQTASQIAETAAEVTTAAEQALQSAAHGQAAVRSSLAGMERIKARINEIVARNLALSTQSRRISEILDTINELATQTHVLALNATIESAGAGVYGRRFAVVAAEVRRLAQDSALATRAVQEIVTQNQAALAAAVQATAAGLKEGEAGLHLAQQSGAANEVIIAEVERTAQLVQAITLATRQQRTASEQVVATMRDMVERTRQVATSSQETLTAVQQLHDVAQALGAPAAPGRGPHPIPPTPAAPGVSSAPERQAAASFPFSAK